MRHKFQQVLDKIHDFLNGHEEPDQTESNSLTATIEEAIQKQTAVHLICLRQALQVTSSNTISNASKLSWKNFAKNVTRIIRISDIQRLRFVPSTVQTAQKNRFKKEWDVVVSSHSFFLANLFKIQMNRDMIPITTSFQVTL